jgi:chemotaxis protein MotD
MMEALSAPRLPVSDGAVSQSQSGRADKADEGGSFSKVLSRSGEQERGASTKGESSDEPDSVATDHEDLVSKTASRGAIDRSLLTLDDALLAELQALPDDVSMGDLVRLLAKAKSKDKAEQGDQPLIEIEGLDPKLKAELAKAMAAVRDKKGTEEADGLLTEQASADAGTAEAPAPDLADVLQLLAAGHGKTTDKSDEAVKGDKAVKEDQKVTPTVEVSPVAEKTADDATSRGDQSEGERDFRFVRADGKGEPLLLRSEGRDGSEPSETKAVETVTVVDSRRYIAPVSTTNGASITAAMLGDSEWVGAMSPGSELANAATHSSQGKVVHTLKIQMTPIELGNVTATLRLHGEELSVQLTVDNQAAFRQLSNDQSDILKALRAQGLVVEQVQVTLQVATTDRSADAGQNGGQSQQSSQQPGQQTFQSGSQGGSERQQDGDVAGNAMRTADERVGQTPEVPANGNRGARPDQLYI